MRGFLELSTPLADSPKRAAVAAAAAVAGCYAMYRLTRRLLARPPPGPWGFPCLGILPQVVWRAATNPGHRMFLLMGEIADKYGGVASFRMGTQEFVLLSDFEIIKEALVAKGDRFSERPHTSVHLYLNDGVHGLVITDGRIWQEQRRFALRVLRSFGFAKTASELRIQEESEHLVRLLRRLEGQEVDVAPILQKAVANIISVLLFSKRNSFEDPGMDEMLRKFDEIVRFSLADSLGALFPQIPSRRWLGRFLVAARQRSAFAWIKRTTGRKVREVREAFDPSEEPANYVEAFLLEQARNRGNPDSTFTETQLVIAIRDLYIAGTDTTSNTLYWALLYAALHPAYQEKCFQEIHAAIGDRQASLKDKNDLPYCAAFLDETQRLSTLVPNSVEHRVSEDTELGGYTISSKAVIFINLYAVHHNPLHFPNPDVFDPSRHLDASGAYQPSEFLIPFSVGRRSCLGESLAKMELILFFVGLLQNFRFEPTAETLRQRESVLLGQEGIVHSPMPYTLRLTSRVGAADNRG